MASLETPGPQKKEERRGIFHINYMLLYWQGMLPDGPGVDTHRLSPRLAHSLTSHRLVRRSLRVFRIVYPRAMTVLMCLSACVVHPCGMIHRWSNKIDVVDNFYPMGLWALIINATSSIMLRKPEFKQLMEKLEDLSRDRNLDNDFQKKLIRNMHRWGYNVFKYLHSALYSGIMVCIPIYSLQSCLPKRKLYFRSWYPYDETVSPAYEITLAISGIEVICGFFMSNSTAAFFITCFLYLQVLFDVLANKFLNIREIAIGRILERKRWKLKRHLLRVPRPRRVVRAAHRVRVRHWESPSRDVTRPRLKVDRDLALVGVSRSRSSRQEIPIPPYTNLSYSAEEVEKEMALLLIEFVNFHRELLRLKNDIDSHLQVYFLISSGINVVIYGATLAILTAHEELSLLELVIVAITVQVVAIFLLINYLCSAITDKAELVGEAMYASDWLRCSVSFKRSMLMVMSRANQPLEFKPPGLEPFSLRNFATISNTAYKMTTTLKNMTSQ